MTILALDTTSEYGGIALWRDGSAIAESALHAGDGFAHVLFERIAQLLDGANCGLASIDCFAAANGPGSFTGVRVGLTVVKGLAEALGRPVAAVSNLRALSTFGAAARRAVILDARRGDVYAAVYDADWALAAPEVVTKLPAWLATLPPDDYEFITWNAAAAFREMVSAALPVAATWVEARESLASAVALCATHDAARGALVSPIAADANYVRRSDAELFLKER